MIQRNIPQKDIKSYQPKLIGPFTARQVAFGIPGIVIALVIIFTLNKRIGDAAYLLAIVFGLPFMLLGFYQPQGQPLEKFLKNAFFSFIAPPKRKYVTESPLKDFEEPNTANKKPAKKKKAAKAPSNPEFREI